MRPITQKKQDGVAVVMAMLIVALAVVVATRLFWQQQTWVELVAATTEHEQLRAIARGGLHWARSMLRDDFSQSGVDHEAELWNTPLPLTKIEDDVELGGRIVDLTGLFNLNALVHDNGAVNERLVQAYRRLLSQAGLSLSLADNLVDWLDGDGSQRQGGGDEDAQYRSGVPPRLAGNRRLADLGDLLLVNGYTPETLHRLRPWVAALPKEVPLNVNMASAEVLSAYVAGLTLGEASTLVAGRKAYFLNRDDFKNRLPRSELYVDHHLIDVQSSYFLVHVHVRRGQGRINMRALLYRLAGSMPVIVWERFE